MFANLVGVKRHIKVPLICLIIVTASLPVGANIRVSVTAPHSCSATLACVSISLSASVFTLLLKPSCLHLAAPSLGYYNQPGLWPLHRGPRQVLLTCKLAPGTVLYPRELHLQSPTVPIFPPGPQQGPFLFVQVASPELNL